MPQLPKAAVEGFLRCNFSKPVTISKYSRISLYHEKSLDDDDEEEEEEDEEGEEGAVAAAAGGPQLGWSKCGDKVVVSGVAASGQGNEISHWHSAVCSQAPMREGQHYAEFTCTGGDWFSIVGVATADLQLGKHANQQALWGVNGSTGSLAHAGEVSEWPSMRWFTAGAVVGLLLDCRAGTLTVFHEGQKVGEAVCPGRQTSQGKPVGDLRGQELYWATVPACSETVTIEFKEPPSNC